MRWKILSNQARLAERGTVAFLGIFLLVSINSCGGGSSSDSTDEETVQSQSIPLGAEFKNLQLTAGQPVEIKFTYTHPDPVTAMGGGKIDITRTLQNVSLSATPEPRSASLRDTLTLLAKALIKDALAASSAQLTAHISFAGDPEVCSSDTVFGPYTVAGGIGMATTSPTESVWPTRQAINIMNTGSLEICLVTTPPIDAYVNVTALEVDIKPCAEPTVSIAGSSWSGTYECDNFGIPNDPPGSPISLSITQKADGSYQYIDDDGAVYEGHLCGNEFRYKGGEPGSYSESGAMVFTDDRTATKNSRWNGIPAGTEGGDCSDTLTRI